MKLSRLRNQLREAERARVGRPSTPPTPNELSSISVEEATVLIKAGAKLRVALALLGPDGKEVAYAGYSRVQVDFKHMGLNLYTNQERVDFPAAASSGTIVSSVLVMGAPGSGMTSLLETVKLTSPFPVLMAEQPFFAVESIKVVLS